MEMEIKHQMENDVEAQELGDDQQQRVPEPTQEPRGAWRLS